jgi:hypothetical protein
MFQKKNNAVAWQHIATVGAKKYYFLFIKNNRLRKSMVGWLIGMQFATNEMEKKY